MGKENHSGFFSPAFGWPVRKGFLLGFFLLISMITSAQGIYEGNNLLKIPEKSSPDQIARLAGTLTPSYRQLKWQEMEITTFIHFSLNTFYDQEWGQGTEDPKRFNPTELDALQWVRTCKEAGSKCVILTCKHHDGFCLWPSRYTNHSVAASPWKNGTGDVVKEVSEACHKEGIGFGVYLSPWDRHEPCYGTDDYNRYFLNQLTELLTGYGEITEVWFDGACGEGPNGKKQVYDWAAYYNLVRQLQPGAVIAVMGPDVRWVGTESGYGRETEWSVVPLSAANTGTISASSQHMEVKEGFIPTGDMTDQDLGSREILSKASTLIWYPSEVDVSIRPGWFWHEAENDKVKTIEKLLDIFFSSVGRNSLLLLNIPPDTRGLIHENDVAVLKEWSHVRDQIFEHNLISDTGTSLVCHSKAIPQSFLNDNTISTDAEIRDDLPAGIEITFNSPRQFDILMLQENIRKGQHIEKFHLEVFTGGKWVTVSSGTTVGYKRLLRFEAVTTDKVRLIIEESRGVPALAEIGLFRMSP